ncbi:MAG: response regulator mprA [Acidimicrobiales bacterium]|nr:response regulator mprA [Acidimicrobiales bacterium]
MRTLLVEDDVHIATMVGTMLSREGHVVEVADSGDRGLWMATEFDFDVVILDWSLPTRDGIEVCEELRARGRWMPILMLTGNSAIDQRVAGLRAGADDYLTKPFAAEELYARLQALTRRTPVERPTVLEVGSLVLDPATRQVHRNGVDIALRPKEYSLLELFMRRAGEVLDRTEILDRVWDLHFDGMSNVVDSHVKSLRNKIDKPFDCESIETVWRVGYRLNAC